MLVAIAAALVMHELLAQRRQIEPNRPFCEDIEVFERDRRGMTSDDRPQHRKRRLARAGIADSREIAVDVALMILRHVTSPLNTAGQQRLYRPRTAVTRSNFLCYPQSLRSGAS